MAAKHGLLVPLVAQTGKSNDVAKFLHGGYDIVQTETETIQWFAVKYADVTPETYAIFDTFTTTSGRDAHLSGKVAEALMANAPKLLSPAPEIGQVEVLASKVVKVGDTKTAGLSVGLRVLFTAKPEKVQAVKEFLIVSGFFHYS
ncbi:hypothetical protein B0H34DRAFT_114875 [Crassisporium funariophilum]|nr:hypothetical protein B0H34DRAFT_114875 [Crassisporium funariophilum]